MLGDRAFPVAAARAWNALPWSVPGHNSVPGHVSYVFCCNNGLLLLVNFLWRLFLNSLACYLFPCCYVIVSQVSTFTFSP